MRASPQGRGTPVVAGSEGSEAEAIVCHCLAGSVDSPFRFVLFPIYSTLHGFPSA
jgi:hypothetical protein